jgi:LacI family transcriptional regulator
MAELLAAHPDVTAVIGFDGLVLGELITPSLTSLVIDKRQVGRLAVEQVARMLAGQEPLTGDGAWVHPELVVRASA